MEKTQIQVLLIEDNPADVVLLRQALEADALASFDLKEVVRLGPALALLQQESFDIILLDLGLPDSQGLDTFIRIHQADPETPTIILSGVSDEDLALQSVQLGAQDYLAKSFDVFSSAARAIRYAIERHKLSRSLRESEARYRLIADNTADVTWVMNPTAGKFTYVSPSVMKLRGYTPEEVMAQPMSDALTPESLKMVSETLAVTLPAFITKGGGTQSFTNEVDQPRKDGSIVHTEVTTTYLFNERGEVEIVGVSRDITERKRTEEALLESSARFRILFEASPDAILLIDPHDEWPILDCNKAACEMNGYTREELVGQSIDILNLTVGSEAERQEYVDDIQKTGILRLESLHRRKDGTLFPIETSTSIMTLGGRQVILGIDRDITERKQAEEKLRESEVVYRRAMEAAGTVPYYESFEDNGSRVNYDFIGAGIRQITGYRPEEFNSQVWDSLVEESHPVEELAGYSLDEGIQKVQAGEIPIWKCEHLLRARDGSIHWVFEAAVDLFDAEGNLRGSIGSYQDITARKQAEEALAHERNLLRTIIDLLPDRIYVKDTESRFQLKNLSDALSIGAASPDELVGKSDADYYPPEMAARFYADDQTVIQSGQPLINHEEPVMNADSTLRWILTTKVPWRNSEGRVIGLVGIGHDITERKQFEDELRQSNERFTELADNVADIFWISEPGTRKNLYFSPAVESIVGLSAEAISRLPNGALDLLLPEDRHIMEEAREHEGIGMKTDVQYRIRRSDGSIRWMRDKGSPVFDENGKVVRVVGIARDMTEQIEAEIKLRESEFRLRQMAENIQEAFWMFDRVAHKHVYSNHAYEVVFEVDEETLNEDPDLFTKRVVAEDLPAVRSVLEKQELGEYTEIEYRIRHANGVIRWVWDRSFPVHDENGKMVRTAGVATDITERKRADEEIRRHAAEFATLYESSKSLAGKTSLDDLLKDIAEKVMRLFGVTGVGVYLYNPAAGILEVKFATHPSIPIGTRLDLGEGLAGKVAKARHSMRIDDYTVWEGRSLKYEGIPVRAALEVPMIYQDRLIGVLVMHETGDSERKFTEADERVLSLFAAQAAAAIENAHLFEETRQRVVELEMLYASGLILNQLSSPKKVGEKIIELLEHKMNWHHSTIRLYNAEDQSLRLIAFSLPSLKNERERREAEERISGKISRPGEGVAGWAMKNNQVVRNGNVSEDPRYRETYPGMRSGLYVPLRLGQNAIGVISVESEQPDAFSESDERLVTTLSSQAAVAIENALLNSNLERRVRERTSEVEDLYNNAPIGYHSLSADGTFMVVNQTELDWMGYTREEMVGKPVMDFLSTQSTAVFQQNFPVFKERGWLKDLELDFLRKDGSILPALVSATIVQDNDGGYFMSRSAVFDNTERKKAEDALRASEGRLNFLLANTPAIIFTTGFAKEMPITFISDSVREVLGHEPRQYLEDPGFWSSLIHPDDMAQSMESIRNLILHGHVIWDSRMKHADGNWLWISTGMSLLRDEQGQPSEVIGYSVDIDDAKKAEEALQISEAQLRQSRDDLSIANAALERASRMKDEFLASMSHELRTPLTGILGLSEALQLKTYGEVNEKQYKTLKTIEESGRHLLELINDILDLSKIEAGKLEMQFSPCSITDICQASLQLTKGMAHKKRQMVHYSPPKEPIIVRADARRLKQILVNLLSNAVKFTREEGELGLEVQADEAGRNIKLTVWDKGIGIQTENIQSLFAPFTQVDSSLAREYSGTGLGLSLVDHLVRLHNGGVEVKSTFGEGSRFTVTLPWSSQNTTPIPYMPQYETRKYTGPLSQLRNSNLPKVFVVDDAEVVLQMIGDYLETRQYNITKARSGPELIREVAETHPDVIILDIQMPGMDGLEAIRLIRSHADPLVAAIPIVAVTALAMSGDRERCLNAGANEYLSKPVILKELTAIIQKLIGNKQ